LVIASVDAALTGGPPAADSTVTDDPRPPTSYDDLRNWLENMVWYHRFTTPEIAAATGLSPDKIRSALRRFGIEPGGRPRRGPGDPLTVLPYPGGRHPRIGFLDGAVRPQRETKVSVFTPWDEEGYVVVDVPEAIWSNLGLTYLAHTHVPTLWTERKIELPPLEWHQGDDGTFSIERTLPNGIRFGATVRSYPDHVAMTLELRNGTSEPLSDLRVQNCVMLKAAKGFAAQTNDNKVFAKPYVACRHDQRPLWVITAWTPCNRAWGNAPCPCLHSDPKFPDCAPRETVRLRGWLSFYEGDDVQVEFRRIDATGWQEETAALADDQ
jgi:hypothetical protein